MRETLKAAETLVADGFQVMVYTSDDPIIARELEQIGCVAIMPLASLIGSGMGILNPWNLRLIIDQAKVPVLVDAGVGTASDAAIAMELGCAGVLMNTAIALAQDPVRMARAMRLAVEAGREAFLAGPHAAQALRGEPELADVRPHLLDRDACVAPPGAGAVRSRASSPQRRRRRRRERVAELCAQVESPAHCGRMIEAEQLKALPNLARRDGDTLTVPLFPVGHARLGRLDRDAATSAATRCGITGARSTRSCCSSHRATT